MAAPEFDKWLELLYAFGVGAAAVVGYFGRMLQRRLTGPPKEAVAGPAAPSPPPGVTQLDLATLHSEIDEERGVDRHNAREAMQRLSVQNELECQRVESNVGEALKGISTQLRDLSDRVGEQGEDIAVLMDRSGGPRRRGPGPRG